MIEKIDISGNGYKIEESFRKYVEKRIGKLDKYLPKGAKKDVVCKVVVSEIGKGKNDKYELSAAMELIAHGHELYYFDSKLLGQIRRYKLEVQPHRQKRSLKNLFKKRG